MKFPSIEGSLFFNLGIICISGFVAWFTLLMGGAHLVEGVLHPNSGIPVIEHFLGILFCIGLCLIGLLSLWVAIGAIIEVVNKFKKRQYLQ